MMLQMDCIGTRHHTPDVQLMPLSYTAFHTYGIRVMQARIMPSKAFFRGKHLQALNVFMRHIRPGL